MWSVCPSDPLYTTSHSDTHRPDNNMDTNSMKMNKYKEMNTFNQFTFLKKKKNISYRIFVEAENTF